MACVLALAAAEFGARQAGLAPELWRIDVYGAESEFQPASNPLLGYLRRPLVGNNNAEGFLDLPRQQLRPDHIKQRVLLLGDSVVESEGAEDATATLGGRLQALLGESVEVISMGISGYCTRSEIALLEDFGLKYGPDLVILLFVENDFENLSDNVVDVMSDARDASSLRPWIISELFVRSHLFRSAAVQWNLFGFGSTTSAEERTRQHANVIGDDNVATGLRLFKELADAHGFSPQIAVWPTFLEDEIVDRDLSDPTNPKVSTASEPVELEVERIARENALPIHRLSGHFRTSYQAENPDRSKGSPNDFFTSDDQMHPNALGREVAAEALAAIIDR